MKINLHSESSILKNKLHNGTFFIRINVFFSRIKIFCAGCLLSFFAASTLAQVGINQVIPPQNLINLTPDQIRKQIIDPSIPADLISNFLFNFGFVNRFKTKLSKFPDGDYAYLDINHYRFFLPYKTQVDNNYQSMDSFITNLSTQNGLSKRNVYAAFGIGFDSDGALKEDASASSVGQGRLMADRYWRRYPLNSPNSLPINDWYDSQSPDALFNEFYPSLVRGYSGLLPSIYTRASVVSGQYAANQKEYDDRQKWLKGPSGQQYQLDQANRQKQAAEAEQARLLRDYPFIAVITCEQNGVNFSVIACFTGSNNTIQTEFELRNGDDYNLYQAIQLTRIGEQKNSGFFINLKSTFAIKAQNSSFQSILGVKIIRRSNAEVLYQKKVGIYGVISVKN